MHFILMSAVYSKSSHRLAEDLGLSVHTGPAPLPPRASDPGVGFQTGFVLLGAPRDDTPRWRAWNTSAGTATRGSHLFPSRLATLGVVTLVTEV